MARSPNGIWIVWSTFDSIEAAFTVKHEIVSYCKRKKLDYADIEIGKYPDGSEAGTNVKWLTQDQRRELLK